MVRGKRVLDIGCRDGLIKSHLGGDVEYYGLEPVEVEPYCPRCNILRGDIQSEDVLELFEKGSFDTIVMAETLEHLSEPLKALLNVRELLTENGQLIGSVPNALSWRFFFFLEFIESPERQDTVWDGSQHMLAFTKTSLANLLTFSGFKVKLVKEWGNWIPHTGIFLPLNFRGGHLLFVAEK